MSHEGYQNAPDSISLREFKAGGKILITTMTCPQLAHNDELKSLYKKRWSVELDICKKQKYSNRQGGCYT